MKTPSPQHSDIDPVETVLTEMVEDTVIFITKDLNSLMTHDEVVKIRRVHKDEILKNLPKALAAINTIRLEDRLDELRELQMSPRIADELKDQIYLDHIKDRLAALTNKGEQV